MESNETQPQETSTPRMTRDPELRAIEQVLRVVDKLPDDEARRRVLHYVLNRMSYPSLTGSSMLSRAQAAKAPTAQGDDGDGL